MSRPRGSGKGNYRRTVTYPTNYGPKNFIMSVCIVWMHDCIDLSFSRIGVILGLSSVASFYHYHRWYNMAHGYGYERPLTAKGRS